MSFDRSESSACGGRRIQIVTRIRPPINGETDDASLRVSSENGNHFISVNNPRDTTQLFKFPFTSCYDRGSKQQEIFDNDVAPMIDHVFHGLTVTIFAYGVTSSGKTHTMQGSKAEPGIIPRAIQAIFNKRVQDAPRASLSLSYMEIYKDEVYDLLLERENAPKLPVREDASGQVFVANLTSQVVETVQQFESSYSAAVKRRSVASTHLNRASSRSHAILTMNIIVPDPDSDQVFMGKLNLVDLAGSENNKLTGNDPTRMQESAAINKSLSVLGQVVHALNRGDSRIPYRNSKLTRILQDALGGSSVGVLICNIAPTAKLRQDTLNTLNFAVRTKNIENKPVVNQTDTRHGGKIKPPTIQNLSANSATILPDGLTNQPTRLSLNPQETSRFGNRLPRPSVVGSNLAGPSVWNKRVSSVQPKPGSTLSEQEIDERIAKAVEAEVARRMATLEAEKSQESQPSSTTATSLPPQNPPARVSEAHETPSEQNELRQRLQDLEDKFENSNDELRLASDLSPLSKKRTGRAYVALARAQSEKNNLQLALELYRKAEAYVPDNIKLKERIIEIEWAVKNGKPFQPSPKRHKRKKSKKATASPRSKGKGLLLPAQPSTEPFDEASDWHRAQQPLEKDQTKSLKRGVEGINDNELRHTPAKKSKTIEGSLD